jgi:hypothetical protein
MERLDKIAEEVQKEKERLGIPRNESLEKYKYDRSIGNDIVRGITDAFAQIIRDAETRTRTGSTTRHARSSKKTKTAWKRKIEENTAIAVFSFSSSHLPYPTVPNHTGPCQSVPYRTIPHRTTPCHTRMIRCNRCDRYLPVAPNCVLHL